MLGVALLLTAKSAVTPWATGTTFLISLLKQLVQSLFGNGNVHNSSVPLFGGNVKPCATPVAQVGFLSSVSRCSSLAVGFLLHYKKVGKVLKV